MCFSIYLIFGTHRRYEFLDHSFDLCSISRGIITRKHMEYAYSTPHRKHSTFGTHRRYESFDHSFDLCSTHRDVAPVPVESHHTWSTRAQRRTVCFWKYLILEHTAVTKNLTIASISAAPIETSPPAPRGVMTHMEYACSTPHWKFFIYGKN